MTTQQTEPVAAQPRPKFDRINVRRAPNGDMLAAQDPWTGEWLFVFGKPKDWPASAVLSEQDVAGWRPLDDVMRAERDAERRCLDVEDVLDAALGPNEGDGTGQGLAADVAVLAQQRDTLAWLHAEACHNLSESLDRENRRRENEHVGYLQHRDAIIKALGQHAALSTHTLMWHITNDVEALREAYDTVENELIEWRTGQRAVEASMMQWGEVTSKLDATLAAVHQLAGQIVGDTQLKKISGKLPAEPTFPSAGQRAAATDLDGRAVVGTIAGFFAWNDETSTNDRAYFTLDDGTETVVTVASLEPAPPAELKFTHDDEE